MKNLLQSDSLSAITDTNITTQVVVQGSDSLLQPPKVEELLITPDSTSIKSEPAVRINTQTPVYKRNAEIVTENINEDIDTVVKFVPEEYDSFIPFSTLNSNDSSKVNFEAQTINSFQSENTAQTIIAQPRNKVRVFEKEWVLGTSFLIIILLILIRAFYQKQLSAIITSVVNLQMADKLLREKNIMVRRAFFLLNAIYAVTLGIYFYQLVKRLNIEVSIKNDFYLFLFILLLLTGIIVLRLIFARFIAFVFDSVPVFKEYLHNTLIINKNLGLYLFPVVISVFYVEQKLGNYLFIVATVMLILSILLRYLKGIQIILKHNIFLFYSILYLCTLEILPVLIGIKFVLER